MLKLKEQRDFGSALPGFKGFVLISLMVFIICIGFTLFVWQRNNQQNVKDKTNLFSSEINHFENNVNNRFTVYIETLRAGASLISAYPNLTHTDWDNFVNTLDTQKRYKGIVNVGYMQYLNHEQIDAFVQGMRQSYSDFKVSPTGERSDYSVIKFVTGISEDHDAETSLGFDMLSDSARSKDLLKSRDSGEPSFSPKVTLIQDQGTERLGFILYMPVYSIEGGQPTTVQSRRKSLVGFVYAAFRTDEFFNQLSGLDTNLAFRVFLNPDSYKTELIYETKNHSTITTADKELSKIITVEIADTVLNFKFSAIDAFYYEPSLDRTNSNFLVSGISLSLAIAMFIFLYSMSRAQKIVNQKQLENQQTKDEFLALASHQLRTPATAVKQYLGLIIEGYTGKLKPEQLDAVNKAYVSNERQLETINQMLYVQKAEAGQLILQKSTISLIELIKSAINDTENIFKKRHQRVQFVGDCNELNLYADQNGIRMVLDNLLTNASKYSQDRTKIIIDCGLSNNYVYFQVTDSGVGIKRQDFSKLFIKFSRIDNPLSIQAGGSGLGLYVDKLIVEAHGGYIKVESNSEKGSKFTVYLPKTDSNQSSGLNSHKLTKPKKEVSK